jgi:PAS domain-containing protein
VIARGGATVGLEDRAFVQHHAGERIELFRKLVEAAPEAVLVTRDRRIVYLNPRFLRLVGYESLEDFGDREQAFAWLGDAIIAHVGDECLDQLELFANEIGDLKRAETVLGRALEEVFDADGIYMETNRSWSIDDKRYNFQFGCEIAWEIRNGKRVRMLKNPSYSGISTEFWNAKRSASANLGMRQHDCEESKEKQGHPEASR